MARTDYSKFTDSYINSLSEADLRKYIRKTADAINKRLIREPALPKAPTNLDKLKRVISEGSDFAIKYREAAQAGIQEGFTQAEVGKIQTLRTSVKNIKNLNKLRDILRQNVQILNTQTTRQHFNNMVKKSGLSLEEFSKLSPESFKDERSLRIAKEHYYDSLDDMDYGDAVDESDTVKDLGTKMRDGDTEAAKELLKRGLISIDDYLETVKLNE